MRWLWVLLLAACVEFHQPAMTGFDFLTGLPPEVAELRPFGPINKNPTYDRWWHEIAKCTGLPLPDKYKDVRFYFINQDRFRPWNMKPKPAFVDGVAYLEAAEIYLGINHALDESIVKHEQAHVLIYWAGKDSVGDHPLEYYPDVNTADAKCGVTRYYLHTSRPYGNQTPIDTVMLRFQLDSTVKPPIISPL